MYELLRKHHVSFKNAWAGVVWALHTQPNFRVHIVLSSVAVYSGYYFRISELEWIIIVFTIVLGLAGEMINTALESMTDLITTEWKQEAKIAKDVSAGMMLIIAIGALIVAYLIFSPYFFSY